MTDLTTSETKTERTYCLGCGEPVTCVAHGVVTHSPYCELRERFYSTKDVIAAQRIGQLHRQLAVTERERVRLEEQIEERLDDAGHGAECDDAEAAAEARVLIRDAQALLTQARNALL